MQVQYITFKVGTCKKVKLFNSIMAVLFHVSLVPYVTFRRHNTAARNELAAAKGFLALMRAVIPNEHILEFIDDDSKENKGPNAVVKLCQDEPYFK